MQALDPQTPCLEDPGLTDKQQEPCISTLGTLRETKPSNRRPLLAGLTEDHPSAHSTLLPLVPRVSLGSPWHGGPAQVTELGVSPGLTDLCPLAHHPMALCLDFFIWKLECAGGGAKWPACLQEVGSLTWLTPFTAPNNSGRQGLSSSLCRAGNGHTERLRDLPEVTQLASSRAGLNSAFWPPSPR